MTIIKSLKFIFFNVVLPLFDTGTDVQAFLLYLLADDHPHPYWALLTLFWIFNPFLVHLCKFVAIYFNTRQADWKNLFLHFPFVIPLNNCYHASWPSSSPATHYRLLNWPLPMEHNWLHHHILNLSELGS